MNWRNKKDFLYMLFLLMIFCLYPNPVTTWLRFVACFCSPVILFMPRPNREFGMIHIYYMYILYINRYYRSILCWRTLVHTVLALVINVYT